MLNGINTGGRYITVTGGNSAPFINKCYSSNSKMQGDMMYDIDSQCIKVFDGNSWQPIIGSMATVDLSYEAQSLLDWAREKREEERLLNKMSQEHPTIKSLVDEIKLKQEQIKMVQALINSPGNEPQELMGS